MCRASLDNFALNGGISTAWVFNGAPTLAPWEGKSYTLPGAPMNPVLTSSYPADSQAAAATAVAFTIPSVEASRAPRFWSTWMAVSAFALSEQGM